MRAVLAVSMLSLVGCSSILGIENPSTGGDDDGSDAGVDAPPSGDHLELSLSTISVMQHQRVKFRAKLVRAAGGSDDVTATATYRSDNAAAVSAATAGQLDSAQAGQATITASYGDAVAATIKVAVKAIECHPVINELTTGSAASAADEFAELYNPCTTAIDVTNWTLNYRAKATVGATDSNNLVTLAGSMAPGEFRVYAGTGYTATVPVATWTGATGALAQNEGSIGLRNGPTATGSGTPGAIVDALGYAATTGNPFIEGTTANAMSNGFALWRQGFDGSDSDNNATDFKMSANLTPGATNIP